MPETIPIQREHRRLRGSRTVGRLLLLVFFVFLAGMNYAASLISPFIGFFGPLYLGSLWIATFWIATLTVALCLREGWARFALAAFLLCCVIAQLVLIPTTLVMHPALKEDGLGIIILLCISYVFVAAFLLASTDIRWLANPRKH